MGEAHLHADNAPYMIPAVPHPKQYSSVQSSFKASHHDKCAIVRPQQRSRNVFIGTRRAFLAAHARKAELARRVLDENWKLQEKQRQWNYRQQMDQLTTNIKLRDDEILRRQNKPHRIKGEIVPRTTTGTRQVTALPRERQSSLYPRNHRFYFGE